MTGHVRRELEITRQGKHRMQTQSGFTTALLERVDYYFFLAKKFPEGPLLAILEIFPHDVV